MLRQIYVDIIHKNIDNVCMKELSMGMTGDYEIAILEGATYVRVGTGIFGGEFTSVIEEIHKLWYECESR